MLVFALVAATTVAVPASAYYFTQPTDDELGATLRKFGFLPLPLPTEHMTVGSLYHVDSSVRFFQAICRADNADLDGAVVRSRASVIKETLLRNGRFGTSIKVDLGWLLNSDAKREYTQTVSYSLTDVYTEEVALDRNAEIFAKLMSKPSCNTAVMDAINAGGYVCQGQKMLQATAEFKLDLATEGHIKAGTKITEDLKGIVKAAIETQAEQSVVEKEGRLFSGTALKYGVSMNPLCLAPPDGRFRRVLPKTVFSRLANFVLFQMVEPVWPRVPRPTAVAQRT
jgi:hypothetical protein